MNYIDEKALTGWGDYLGQAYKYWVWEYCFCLTDYFDCEPGIPAH
jgi:hypothetical protein